MGEKKHLVLIADDYETDRFFLKEAIREHAPNLQVIGEVVDGEEVISYLSGADKFADREHYPLPEILFLDMRMPRVTGIEVLAWLKEHPLPGLKVAVLADSSSTQYRPQVLELGVEHFYSKLMDRSELITLVKRFQNEVAGSQAGTRPAEFSQIPPLLIGDVQIDPHRMPFVVVWGNGEVSRFYSAAAAKAALNTETFLKASPRAREAKVFSWDGTAWGQVVA